MGGRSLFIGIVLLLFTVLYIVMNSCKDVAATMDTLNYDKEVKDGSDKTLEKEAAGLEHRERGK